MVVHAAAAQRQARLTVMPPPRPAPGALPALDAAFAALADGKRREVIGALLAHPQRAGDLARAVRLTPPALSRHLRILRHAGLVREDADPADARVRIYRVEETGFAPVSDWIADVEAFWSVQLAAFKEHVERRGGDTGKAKEKAMAGRRRRA